MTRHDYGRIGDVEIYGDANLVSEAVGAVAGASEKVVYSG